MSPSHRPQRSWHRQGHDPGVRAIQISQTGGPEVLNPVDLPDPEPAPRGGAGRGRRRGRQLHRHLPPRGHLPDAAAASCPAWRAPGGSRASAKASTGVAVGDRVAWAEALGSYAELVAVPADKAVPVPDGVSDELAVGALLQGMTAHVPRPPTPTRCSRATTSSCTPRQAVSGCCSPSSRPRAAPG